MEESDLNDQTFQEEEEDMALLVSKRRSAASAREANKNSTPSSSKEKPDGLLKSLCRVFYQIPAVLLLLTLLFLWSSSSIMISGSFVHVCVTSRKLNNVYCLSAGSQPNFKLPIPIITNNTDSITNHSEEYYSMNAVTKEVSIPIMNIIQNRSNSSRNSNSSNDDEYRQHQDEIVNAIKVVEEQVQVHRSWASQANKKVCEGRGIFVYDLPAQFNKDLMDQCNTMVPWVTNFCDHFKNEGMGEEITKLGNGWYHTHQYSLEPIFHSRALKHPCRVYNENEAKLFYVPYYGGLDILRWHFRNVTEDVKDSLGSDLLKWLGTQSPWVRNSGKDHVFVLGKISWDFRRKSGSSWGTSFLEFDQMQNPMKLLIERQPWHINDIGIPHPTYFHPHTDNDIVEWQSKIISSARDSLVSFAGAERPGAPENIRSILINQCTSRNNTSTCRFLDCNSGGCTKPEMVIELFTKSEFCLQPPGDSPTRKSVFDSLVSGCIPVLFDPFTAYYQYPWHLPEDHGLYSVFVDQEDVREMKVDVVERLMKVSKKERDDMRRYIVYELLPRLVYGDSNSQFEKFEDAFSVSMNNLVDRVNALQSKV